MDRRSWPWKKKPSDKNINEKPMTVSDSGGASLSSLASLGDQENYKKVNYVQISMDSYKHLNGLEDQVNTLKDQVKLFEDEVKDLKEKLSAAHSDINAKESLVMQHAKVAEEAVSGWEKADAETLALKLQLESVTLLKLTAEDRASHLDGALKECMRQIRNVKEESEQKLHDVILTKTKQWEKIKLELEGKIVELDQELIREVAENAALFRSLQERSNLIVKINEEKSQAEAEIEFLKENIQSHEKEISSLKYELHVVSKEFDIRNEEKNMSVRSAEIANKQHLEGVKKIAKLEAECQRLRGLVRKKLPGPAALAQMKVEVENLGHEFRDPRIQRATVKNLNPYLSPKPEISIDNLQQSEKETEFLTTRLLAMEEETQMLKKALATRNNELQVSRNMCAKTVDLLKSLEAKIQAQNQQRGSTKLNLGIPTESSSSKYASNNPSITSMSEDGTDEEGTSSESWAPVISDFCELRMGKSIDESGQKPENANCLKLMDDFLEMESLAANGAVSISSNPNNARNFNAEAEATIDAFKGGDILSEQHPGFDPSVEQDPSSVKPSPKVLEPDADHRPLSKLRSRIFMIFESQTEETDIGKVVEDVKCAIQEIQGSPPQYSLSCISKVAHTDDAFCSEQACSQDAGETQENQILLTQDSQPGTNTENSVKQELASAILHIHQSVLSLTREVMQIQNTSDGNRLSENLEDFSASVDKYTFNEMGLVDFVLKLSHVLAKASDLNFGVPGFKRYDGDVTSSDYIDKVTLLENKIVQDHSSKQTCISECHHGSDSCSEQEVLQDGVVNPSFGSDVSSCKCLLKEFEQLKLEKDNIVLDLARCTQDLENTKLKLHEKEQLLPEMKLQLASLQKLYSLAETKLKCMTESYKSLEVRAQNLEAEVNLLREKTEKLKIELSEEKCNHQDALARCNNLQDKVQRNETCSNCSLSSVTHSDLKTKQEREIAAASEKLAACQETIYLLGKQLQALHPQTGISKSQFNEKLQLDGSSGEGKSNHSCSKPQDIHCSNDFDQVEIDSLASTDVHWVSEESIHYCNSASSPSDIEATLSFRSSISSTHPSHILTKSSSSSVREQDVQRRGFGRFFSVKGKNEH